MITFSEPELKVLSESPEALEVVADYHDAQESMGTAMGFDCKFHEKRRKELREEAARLRALYES